MEKNELTNPPPAAGSAGAPAPVQRPASAVRVWLVDDNEQIRSLVADLLGRSGGIECARQFSSPDALLSVLASKPGPDVILLDVQMGDRNGLEAVRPIKSLTRSTRVLMFTSANNRDWRERALRDGAADYLLKSEDMEHVAARIRSPEDDPAPALAARRRASCSPQAPLQGPPVSPVVGPAPRLWSRTLKMLGLSSN
jgi:CheY-like chemotaxis protein